MKQQFYIVLLSILVILIIIAFGMDAGVLNEKWYIIVGLLLAIAIGIGWYAFFKYVNPEIMEFIRKLFNK